MTFLKDNRGASAVEYALIIAIVGAAVAFASMSLVGAIGNHPESLETHCN